MKGNQVTQDAGRPSVVVIGGGYAGVNVAKALDEVADVTLVEPKDAFFTMSRRCADWSTRGFSRRSSSRTAGSWRTGGSSTIGRRRSTAPESSSARAKC